MNYGLGYIYTHTHTHIYIYIYIKECVCLFIDILHVKINIRIILKVCFYIFEMPLDLIGNREKLGIPRWQPRDVDKKSVRLANHFTCHIFDLNKCINIRLQKVKNTQ